MKPFELIDNGIYDFKGQIFDYKIHLSSNIISNPRYLRFFKCVFNNSIHIERLNYPNIIVSFSDCIFNAEVQIEHCHFLELRFTTIIGAKDIFIDYLHSELLCFNSQNTLTNDIIINHSNVINLDCSNLKDLRGQFVAEINRNVESYSAIRCSFRNSSICSFQLYGNIGAGNFEGIYIEKTAFIDAKFNTSYFNNAFFGLGAMFNECEFSSTISFKNCRVPENEITFQVCTFQKHVFFSDAEFENLYIRDTTFESRASFLGLNVECIKLHLVNFNKAAHFDDIKIRNIAGCDRKTLRTIKQELQKTDNKIDYNRFRAYELSAYYREINWKWKEGFKDKFILAATWLVTGFEHSWRRALGFTLISAVVFYTLFYISENYYLALDLNEWQPFASSYFRFLIVTDFYNPLADGRTYIDNTNTVGWFIFILGKIFIAFGIYEMIQAFRKFKA